MSGMKEASMNVLLSIKPEFAEKILKAEKRYEFRKTGFRDYTMIDKVFMYASAPDKRIVGVFTIDNEVETNPEQLWSRFGEESGIDEKERFMDYFAESETGYAFKINAPQRLVSPVDPRTRLDEFQPPVSFQYINGEFDFVLEENELQPVSQGIEVA